MHDPYAHLPEPYYASELNRAGVRGMNSLHTHLLQIAKVLGFGRLCRGTRPKRTNGVGLSQRGPDDLTPAEIQRRAAEIRAEWSEEQEINRRCGGFERVAAVVPGADQYGLVEPHEVKRGR